LIKTMAPGRGQAIAPTMDELRQHSLPKSHAYLIGMGVCTMAPQAPLSWLTCQMCLILRHIFLELLSSITRAQSGAPSPDNGDQKDGAGWCKSRRSMRGEERRVWGGGNGMAGSPSSERRKTKREAQAGGDQVVERPTRCSPSRPGSLGRAVPTLIIAEGTMWMA
jgi:hypothetical protein